MIKKKLNKFSLIILCLIVLTLSSLVFAAPAITKVGLISPVNGTFDNDGAVTFVFNVTHNISEPFINTTGATCNLYWNQTGVWASAGSTNTNVSNATYENITKTGIPEGDIAWTIGCTAPGNGTIVYAPTVANESAHQNFTFIVDTTAPVITLTSPRYASWLTNGQHLNGAVLSVADGHADTCVLESNINIATNSSNPSTSFNFSVNVTSYVSETAFTMRFGNFSNAFNLSDNNTGTYLWNAWCNDTAGNVVRLNSSGNMTFFVDSIAPSSTELPAAKNNSKSSDLTPLFTWLNSFDKNFSRYDLQVDDDVDFSSLAFNKNITSNSTNVSIVTTSLSQGTTYYVRVLGYDLAGNSYTSQSHYTYRTDDNCVVLVAGQWNICGIIRSTPVNASDLCVETSCTFIAQYNASREFQIHTSGSSTNGDMMFVSSNHKANESSVVFIYVETTNKTWENRTWDVDMKYVNYTLKNLSNGWNIVPILNQTTTFNFGKLDASLNGLSNGAQVSHKNNSNVSKFMSLYVEENSSSSRFVSFFHNRSFQNQTVVKYGDAVWINYNRTGLEYYWSSQGEIS
jgi:hypothetical protein